MKILWIKFDDLEVVAYGQFFSKKKYFQKWNLRVLLKKQNGWKIRITFEPIFQELNSLEKITVFAVLADRVKIPFYPLILARNTF